MSEYYNKYLKYKQKYLNLKKKIGGAIGIDRILLPEEITLDLEVPEIPGLKIKDPILKIPYNYDIMTLNSFVVLNNKTYLIWSYDASKPYIDKNNDRFSQDPDFINKLSLRNHGMYSKFYILVNSEINKQAISNIIKYSQFQTPYYDQNIPYQYVPHFFVNCLSFNLFKSIHSDKFNDDINDKLCLSWLSSIYNNVKKLNTETMGIQSNLINNGFVKLNVPGQPMILLNYYPANSHMKIHLNVKLEYLFWTLETIILNLKKFIVDDKLIIPQFKFMNKFYLFNGILEKFFSDYPYLNENDKIFDTENNTWSFISEPDIKYKFEDIYEPNIVLYLKKEVDYSLFKKNVQHVINVLIELFPDSLDIGSGKFPRFNFKVNNTIYFAIGDSTEKINKTNSKIYIRPTNLHQCTCREKTIEECNNFNEKIKKIIDKEPCQIHGSKCIENNIYSLNLMTVKDPIPYLYFKISNGKINNFNSLEEIYEFIGQPIPN